MNGELFEEWLYVLDNKFHHKGRTVVMTIDNCPSRPNIEKLKTMTIAFLPKNTTSITHPMDQGVIRSLTTKYSAILVRRIITALDNNKAIPKFNILEAIYMFTRAWGQVSTTTIVNCFKKAKVSATSHIEAINDSDDPFSDLKYQLDELMRRDSSLLQGDSAEKFRF